MPSTEPTPYQRLIPFESSSAPPRVEHSSRPFHDYLGDARRANLDAEANRQPQARHEPQRQPETEQVNRDRTAEAAEKPEERSTPPESDGTSAAKQEPEANTQDAHGESQAAPDKVPQEESDPPADDPPANKATAKEAAEAEVVVLESEQTAPPTAPPEPAPATTSNEGIEQAKQAEPAAGRPTDGNSQVAPADKSATNHDVAGISVDTSGGKLAKPARETATEQQPTQQPTEKATKQPHPSATAETSGRQQEAIAPAKSGPTDPVEQQVDRPAGASQTVVAAKPDVVRKAASVINPPTEAEPRGNPGARASTDPAQPAVATTAPAAGEKKVDSKATQKSSDRPSAARPTAIAPAAKQGVAPMSSVEVAVSLPADEAATVEELAPVEGKPAGNERQTGNSAAPPREAGVVPQAAKTPASLVPPPREGAGDTTSLSPQERTRFVQRVANAFQAASQHEGEIRLRLSPPELGQLKLEISIKQGVLTARMEADTPEARQVLLENLPQLRERLAEQSIRVEKFDVDVRDEGAQHQTDEQSDRAQRHKTRRQGENLESEATQTPHAASTPSALGSDQLDIVI